MSPSAVPGVLQITANGDTALHIAAKNNHLDAVEALLGFSTLEDAHTRNKVRAHAQVDTTYVLYTKVSCTCVCVCVHWITIAMCYQY